MYASYDYTMWPLVVVTIANITPTPRQFEEYLAEFGRLLERKACFRVLFDISKAKAIPIDFLTKQVAFLKEHKDSIANHLLCSGIVITSTVVRGLIRMMFTVYKLTRPNKVFKSKQEAMAWITTVSIDGKGNEEQQAKFFFEE